MKSSSKSTGPTAAANPQPAPPGDTLDDLRMEVELHASYQIEALANLILAEATASGHDALISLAIRTRQLAIAIVTAVNDDEPDVRNAYREVLGNTCRTSLMEDAEQALDAEGGAA